ncbi:MarR family transcriptional regulator [Sphingosinicella sp. LHD-64]|uniref:MarR family winged helix-turn-helix transcriptional regulator n=1 Tax=Sphingosinicella sp. LHD-64 TaxID=3072139 RepID=UPI00280F6066|nr:MarR family transcriptional regulator [Sphingosinicella sp. LHD-64]MDQ8758162.1 MarR family transcriptional regulator [Sphingosinicella sp. LHD-64]
MERFAIEVVETAHALRRDFDRRAAVLGSTRAQWRVLAKLSRRDGQKQVELAEALDVEPITLSRMVDRLAEAGYVERRQDEADRRVWRIHLTQRALPVLEELDALSDVFHADLLAGVSSEDRAVASRVLARVRDNLNAIQTRVSAQ